MATGTDTLGEANCAICCGYWREPTALPCSHVFCRPCVEQLALHSNGFFRCPSCRFYVESNAAEDLRDLRGCISAARKNLEALEKALTDHEKAAVSCDVCKAEMPASDFDRHRRTCFSGFTSPSRPSREPQRSALTRTRFSRNRNNRNYYPVLTVTRVRRDNPPAAMTAVRRFYARLTLAEAAMIGAEVEEDTPSPEDEEDSSEESTSPPTFVFRRHYEDVDLD